MTTSAKSDKIPETLSFSSYGQFAVKEDGTFADVSLISVGEALGHGVSVDMRSLETAYELIGGKSIKAFNGHSWAPKGSDIVGMFSGNYIDTGAQKLRSKNFNWLAAFKKHREGEYDTLKELATDHPEQFGVSLTHRFGLVWVFDKGVEIDAMRDWWYGNEAPEGALNELPAVRFKAIISADFVGSPAANEDGLFSSKQQGNNAKPSELSEAEFTMNILKDIQSAFGTDKDLLAEAIQFATANDGADFSKVKAHVEQFRVGRDLKAKDDEIAGLKQQLSTKDQEIQAKQDEVTKLQSKLDQVKGGQSEFSTGEDPKPEGSEADEPKSYTEQYQQLSTPRERDNFRKKHGAELEKEAREAK